MIFWSFYVTDDLLHDLYEEIFFLFAPLWVFLLQIDQILKLVLDEVYRFFLEDALQVPGVLFFLSYIENYEELDVEVSLVAVKH